MSKYIPIHKACEVLRCDRNEVMSLIKSNILRSQGEGVSLQVRADDAYEWRKEMDAADIAPTEVRYRKKAPETIKQNGETYYAIGRLVRYIDRSQATMTGWIKKNNNPHKIYDLPDPKDPLSPCFHYVDEAGMKYIAQLNKERPRLNRKSKSNPTGPQTTFIPAEYDNPRKATAKIVVEGITYYSITAVAKEINRSAATLNGWAMANPDVNVHLLADPLRPASNKFRYFDSETIAYVTERSVVYPGYRRADRKEKQIVVEGNGVPLLSATEAAAILKVDRSTVYNYRNKGVLTELRVDGARRYDRVQVIDLANKLGALGSGSRISISRIAPPAPVMPPAEPAVPVRQVPPPQAEKIPEPVAVSPLNGKKIVTDKELMLAALNHKDSDITRRVLNLLEGSTEG